MQEAYFEMLSHGDDKCPGHDTHIDDTFLYGCSADTGYWYSGVSEFIQQSGEGYDADVVAGDFKFIDWKGQAFNAGGHVALVFNQGNNQRGWIIEISGSWIWEGEPVYSWLANGVSGSLQVTLNSASEGDFMMFNGALSLNDISLDFTDFKLLSTCDDNTAVGVLSIRDPTGTWHSLDYGDQCSPCAQVSWEGEPTGELCPDLSPIVATFKPYFKDL